MVRILAKKTSVPGCEMPGTSETVRAEALFASTLQPSGSPSPDQVRRAVSTTLRRLGARGCAAKRAGEVGDHPGAAAARRSWGLAATPRATRDGPRPRLATCDATPCAR